MEASLRKARALRLRFSQSLASRRQRFSQAIVRSTIQRLGNGTNPLARSERLTISVLRLGRTLPSAVWKIDPAYALSANSFAEKRKLTEQRGQQPDAAIAILNASGMNDRVQQQTLHVDENMSFLAFDQFARIEPVRINAGPPFSALFTLWLSMMQAVGLASRSAFSRHSTYSA